MPSNKSLITIRILLLLAFVCVPSIAAAQKEKPTGRSVISGRVLYADSERPVRRATVKLYLNLTRQVRATPANARGEFRFDEVAAGSYYVIAEVPGIISPSSGFSLTELGFNGN